MPTPPHHELRRADHAIVDAEALVSLLRAARVGRVGVIAAGEPYVVPMNFAYEGTGAGTPARIIIHGASQGRLIEALARDGRVCFEVDELLATLPDPVLCAYPRDLLCTFHAGRRSRSARCLAHHGRTARVRRRRLCFSISSPRIGQGMSACRRRHDCTAASGIPSSVG